MNKRQKKKNLQKCIGKTISLKYGTILRKYLGLLYATEPHMFEYFNKKKLKRVWKNIQKDSIPFKDPCFFYKEEYKDFTVKYLDWRINLEKNAERFITHYEHLKKHESKYDGTPWMKPSTSWVVNFNF